MKPIYISILIIVIGSVLRLNVYLQNRALFIDEANVARNIVERGYGDFFESLDYYQYVPPLLAMGVKAGVECFGVNEYALKILPLLSSLVLLLLLHLLLKHFVNAPPARWYVLGLLAFSTLAIRYGTELKQYSIDAALTLFVVLIGLRVKGKKWTIKRSFLWSIGGAVLIWTSMPIIFVLAALGFAFLYDVWDRDKREILFLFGIGGFWILNFGLYFFMVLKSDADSNYLQSYHNTYFFSFIPTSVEEFNQSWTLLINFFELSTDKTVIPLTFSILAFIIGSYILIKKDKYASILLFGIIGLTLVASHLKYYSLLERLTLFLIPIFMLIIGIGVSKLWLKSNLFFRVLLSGIMILSLVNKKGYYHFFEKLEIEDPKTLMTYLKENIQQKEHIYVNHYAVPAFAFYNDHHDNAYSLKNYYLEKWGDKPAEIIKQKVEKGNEFWILFVHTSKEDIQKTLKNIKPFTTILNKQTSKKGQLFYLKRLKN